MDTPLEPKISLTSGHAKVINRKDQHIEDKQMVITEPLNHFNTCTLANECTDSFIGRLRQLTDVNYISLCISKSKVF